MQMHYDFHNRLGKLLLLLFYLEIIRNTNGQQQDW